MARCSGTEHSAIATSSKTMGEGACFSRYKITETRIVVFPRLVEILLRYVGNCCWCFLYCSFESMSNFSYSRRTTAFAVFAEFSIASVVSQPFESSDPGAVDQFWGANRRSTGLVLQYRLMYPLARLDWSLGSSRVLSKLPHASFPSAISKAVRCRVLVHSCGCPATQCEFPGRPGKLLDVHLHCRPQACHEHPIESLCCVVPCALAATFERSVPRIWCVKMQSRIVVHNLSGKVGRTIFCIGNQECDSINASVEFFFNSNKGKAQNADRSEPTNFTI